MNAVGIDVSKGKSTITMRRPANKSVVLLCDFLHTQSGINELIEQNSGFARKTKGFMEHTDRCYEPLASSSSEFIHGQNVYKANPTTFI